MYEVTTRLLTTTTVLASLLGACQTPESPELGGQLQDAPWTMGHERARLVAAQRVMGAWSAALKPAARMGTASWLRSLVPAQRPESAERTYTIAFSGNLHGRREDCGCKSNPLGGVARRA
ncbi:MAG: hypothetical protein AAGI01_13945, partial [Myxococcota bacterium]